MMPHVVCIHLFLFPLFSICVPDVSLYFAKQLQINWILAEQIPQVIFRICGKGDKIIEFTNILYHYLHLINFIMLSFLYLDDVCRYFAAITSCSSAEGAFHIVSAKQS